MPAKRKPLKIAQRVAVHRTRRRATGQRRVELTVPAEDVSLLRAVAERLRDGGTDAERLRDRIAPLLKPVAMMTGREFADALRIPAMSGADLDLRRDAAPLRSIDLG